MFDQAGYNTAVTKQKADAVATAQAYADAIASIPGEDAAIQHAQAQNVVTVLNDPTSTADDIAQAYADAGYTGSTDAVDEGQFWDDQTYPVQVQPDYMTRDEWLATAGFSNALTQEQWETGQDSMSGPSFTRTPKMNPRTFEPNRTRQEELIYNARMVTPPAVTQVLQGEMPRSYQLPFGVPTFQQLQSLTPDERDAMNTRLMTEFNVPMRDVEWQANRQWLGGPSVDRNRRLAEFRGYRT